MSPAELCDLAARRTHVTVEETAQILGVPRSTAYAAIRAGTFPVPVIKVSARRWVVPTAHLVALLGLDPPGEVVPLRAVP